MGDLLKDIATLEAKHKETASASIKQDLDIKLSKLHLLEASQAAKSLLYTKKHIFEYRVKPNKVSQNSGPA